MDRKTVIAIILITIVIIATPFYQKLVNKNQVPVEQQELISDQKTSAAEDTALSEKVDVPRDEKSNVEQLKAPEEKSDSLAAEGYQEIPEKKPEVLKVLENELCQLEISSRGAVISKIYLKKYLDNREGKENQPVQLIPQKSKKILNNVIQIGNRQIDLSEYSFELTAGSSQITANSHIPLSETDTIEVIKTYRFGEKDYSILFTYDIRGNQIATQNRVEWNHSINPTEKDHQDDFNYTTGYAKMGDVITEEKIADDDEEEVIDRNGKAHWVGLKNKYFLTALISQENASGIILKGQKISDEEKKVYAALRFEEQEARQNELMIYAGPIEYTSLRSFGIALDKTVDLGMMIIKPFSIAITYILIYLNKLISSYGLIIILFALLIKIITFPLTHKSFEATKRMSELQPKIAELKEKYSKEPQKLNAETMKLYKKEKINPLGGCLPMLLQMPIFFGLYKVFASTIMLRNESFFWVDNLSAKDPTLILPIVMTVFSLIQNMLTMKDPKQKMMIYFMPIFLFFIFKNLAAGLVLYWTCFNVLQIIQQELINKLWTSKKK